MQISAIENKSLVELVEEKILDVVRRNNLSAGDSLPAELELTELLGVSRSVVREALSRLRMLGLLESRKRRGMVIAEPDVFGGCKNVLDAAFLTEQTQQNLYEMRLALELGISDFLFLRKTDQDLVELEEIVERGEQAVTEKARLKLEIGFHTKLYQIARNNLLLRFKDLLEPFFLDVVKREETTGRRRGEATHRDLLDELRSGTPEGFRNKMHLHLQPHFSRLNNNDREDI